MVVGLGSLLPISGAAAETAGLDLLREHIAFVESTYQKWIYFGGIVSIVLIGLVTFFGIRTKRDVEELVDRRFATEADVRIRTRLEAFMETLNDEVRPKIAQLSRTIDELTEQGEKTDEGSADALAQIA